MTPTSFITQYTGMPAASLFDPRQPLVKMQSIAGVVSISYWDPSIAVVQPTPAVFAAGLAAPEPAPSASDLQAYATSKQGSLLSTAQAYSVGGTPSLSVLSDALPDTQTDLQALYDWGAANPTATQPWVDNAGIVTTLTGAQFVTLRPLVKAYRIAVFATFGAVLDGTAATPPTITTTAQIDAAAWPTP